MLIIVGKQSGKLVESVQKKKRKATVGRICEKRKVFSLESKTDAVMDDENGELMEPIEEVPLRGLERLVRR